MPRDKMKERSLHFVSSRTRNDLSHCVLQCCLQYFLSLTAFPDAFQSQKLKITHELDPLSTLSCDERIRNVQSVAMATFANSCGNLIPPALARFSVHGISQITWTQNSTMWAVCKTARFENREHISVHITIAIFQALATAYISCLPPSSLPMFKLQSW